MKQPTDTPIVNIKTKINFIMSIQINNRNGITFNRNNRNEIIKDKIDFLKFYEDETTNLKENIFYRSLNNKVLIKIAIPCNSKQIKQTLSKIKD